MPDPNPLILKLTQSGQITSDDHDLLLQVSSAPYTVAAGMVLLEQEGHPTGTPLIMSGFAYRYRRLRDGKRQVLGLLIPGDCCDVQGVTLSRSDHGTAALTECEIVWLPRQTIDELTLAPTRIARALWWSTLVDECILRSWLTNMGQRDAAQSLAHFLCELLLRLQIVGCAESDGCEFPFSQELLADLLGITAVHVSRTLKELRERELAFVQKRRLTIPDVAALRAFCDFDPTYLHLNGDSDRSMA